MTTYRATCRDIDTGKVTSIISEYESKKDFRDDIHRNGYVILRNRVYDPAEWAIRMDAVC